MALMFRSAPVGLVRSVPASQVVTGMNFIASYTPSGPQGGFSGFAGFQFTINTNMTVTALGRYVSSGNSHTHTVMLFDPTLQSVLPGGSVSVNMAGGTPGTFVYANLATPVVLLAGHSYYLLSVEASGLDQLLTPSSVTPTAQGTVDTGIYSTSPTPPFGFNAFPGGSVSQGLVNFVYTVGGTPSNTVVGSPWPILGAATFPPALALRESGFCAWQPTISAGMHGGAVGHWCSGTITITGTFFHGNGGGGPVPSNNDVVMQPYVDSQPFGSPVTGGPNVTFQLDTTSLTEGTHVVWARVVAAGVSGMPTSNVGSVPVTIIVQNMGSLTTSQTIPVTMWNTFGQDVAERFYSPVPDFVTFPGTSHLPLHNNSYPYPAPTIAPSSDPMYRNAGNFYVESVIMPFRDEYECQPFFQTTQNGGVFANPYNGQIILDIFGSYDLVKNSPLFDGSRIDNYVTAYTTYIEHPSGAYWVGVDLSGRVYTQGFDGTVTTIYGIVRDRSKLSIDYDDTSVSDAQIDATSITIGTIGSPSFGDFRGANDICYDPRDTSVNTTTFTATISGTTMTVTGSPSATIKRGMYISSGAHNLTYILPTGGSGSGGAGTYTVKPSQTVGSPTSMTAGFSQTIFVAKTIDHMIYKANLNTGVAVRYAGQDGTFGYMDGAATSVALFNEPFGICVADGTGVDAAGTLYVADSGNNAIRKVDSTGTTVSTLLGGQAAPSPSLGATVTYTGVTMTYVSTTSGVATISVVLPNGQSPYILTGQNGPGNLLGCAVSITGAVNSGSANLNNQPFGPNAAFFLNGFTDSQHFTIAVNVGVNTVGAITGSISLVAYYNDVYSPPGTVSFSGGPQTQYAFFPQGIRFDSVGRLCYCDTNTGSVRRIDLAALTVTRLGWNNVHPNNIHDAGFSWLDVDTMGTCGPVDDVIFTSGDEGYFRCANDGTFNSLYYDELEWWFSEGPQHAGYPWAVAFSRFQGRFISNGISQEGSPNSFHIYQAGDPGLSIDPPTNIDTVKWSNGMYIHELGTLSMFPFGSRPSFKSLMGARGVNYLGVLPTFPDLMTGMYASTTPGDTGDQNLAAYIQAGMGGTVPRPEITGNDLRDYIYFIRRTTLAGAFPTPVLPGPWNTDFTPAVISNVVATRNSPSSITVTFTTDKSCLCVLGVGLPRDVGMSRPYTWWQMESTYTSGSHTITITGASTVMPTHYSVLAKDASGNLSYTKDASIGISPDGTQIDTLNSVTGSVVNGYGVWSFGPTLTPGTGAGPPGPFGTFRYVKLNGKVISTFPEAQAIRIDDSGQAFFLTTQNDRWWYLWVGSTGYFAGSPNIGDCGGSCAYDPPSTAPAPPTTFQPPYGPSADGTTISGGSGSVTTADGVWTFGTISGGAYPPVLNGVQLTALPNGSNISTMKVSAQGNLFAQAANNSHWYAYLNHTWQHAGASMPSGAIPVEVTLTVASGLGPSYAPMQNLVTAVTTTTTLGTVVASIAVTMSDGSAFSGSFSVSGSGAGNVLVASGSNLVLNVHPSVTFEFYTVTATSGGQSTSAGASTLELNVSS